MRIPLAGNISTKDGAANKNSRLYNVLAETRKDGKVVAGVRPGLNIAANGNGNGNGIVCFNNELISITGMSVVRPLSQNYTLTTYTAPVTFNALVCVAGGYIARTMDKVYSSSDFSTWGNSTLTLGVGEFYSASWGSALRAATNGSEMVTFVYKSASAVAKVIQFDRSISSYEIDTSSEQIVVSDLIWQSSEYVMVPDVVNVLKGFSQTSTDGATWSISDTYMPTGGVGIEWSSVSYGSNMYLAAGVNTFLKKVYVANSSDGRVWGNLQQVGTAFNIPSCAWSGSAFILVSGSYVYVSDEYGENWQAQSYSGTQFIGGNLKGIQANGAIVYAGYGGIRLSFDNGASWSDADTSINYDNLADTHEGDGFIAYGKNQSYSPAQTTCKKIKFESIIGSVEDQKHDFCLIP